MFPISFIFAAVPSYQSYQALTTRGRTIDRVYYKSAISERICGLVPSGGPKAGVSNERFSAKVKL